MILLGPFIHYMANLVPIIKITVSRARLVSNELMQSWEEFAANIIHEGAEKVRIVNAGKHTNFYRQPFLEFADQFIGYLNEQIPMHNRSDLTDFV